MSDQRDESLLPDRDRLVELAEEAMRYWRQDRKARERDRLSTVVEVMRRPLHRNRFADVTVLHALAVPFQRKIPGRYWTQIALGVAEVSCPCAAVPVLEMAVVKACSGSDCGRYYLYDGADVRVAFSPSPPDADEDGDEEHPPPVVD